MIHLPKHETKVMIAVHGWSGIVLGLLLYAVVLTGTAAVFAEEIGAWSAGHLARQSAFAPPLTATLGALRDDTPEAYRGSINLFEVGDHQLAAFFHRDEMDGKTPIARGVFYVVDTHGRVVHRHEGTDDEVTGPRNDNALRTFLVDTHVRLHLPNPWGLLLTGLVGLSMLIAAISGLLIHRHLFKDIFTLRRKASPGLANRDRHSVSGTWSLPFAFILAFTGSFFSFFGTVGVPIVAMAAFGGDVHALQETIFGNPSQPDPRPAAIGSLDRILVDATARAGATPTFVAIEHLGRVDAEVTTFHPPRSHALSPMTLVYDGATARFEREKPLIGPKPSAGGTLAAIMSPLHFGNFAGVASKAVWFGLGFAICYVTYTGLRLWLVRRDGGRRSLDWLERATVVVGIGLPLALATAAATFLVSMPFGSATWWTPAGFLGGAAAAIAAGFLASSALRLAYMLRLATGLLLLLLPACRLATGGPGWETALAAGQPVIAALDIAFVIAGIWTLWPSARTPLASA